jgi:hypothetical protein
VDCGLIFMYARHNLGKAFRGIFWVPLLSALRVHRTVVLSIVSLSLSLSLYIYIYSDWTYTEENIPKAVEN